MLWDSETKSMKLTTECVSLSNRLSTARDDSVELCLCPMFSESRESWKSHYEKDKNALYFHIS